MSTTEPISPPSIPRLQGHRQALHQGRERLLTAFLGALGGQGLALLPPGGKGGGLS